MVMATRTRTSERDRPRTRSIAISITARRAGGSAKESGERLALLSSGVEPQCGQPGMVPGLDVTNGNAG